MIPQVLSDFKTVNLIKGDMKYSGAFKDIPLAELGITLECVKSNYGKPVFVLFHAVVFRLRIPRLCPAECRTHLSCLLPANN